jgi:hypothetical protein
MIRYDAATPSKRGRFVISPRRKKPRASCRTRGAVEMAAVQMIA